MTDEPMIATETITPSVPARRTSPLLWLLVLISLIVAILSLLPWFVPSLVGRLPLGQVAFVFQEAKFAALEARINNQLQSLPAPAAAPVIVTGPAEPAMDDAKLAEATQKTQALEAQVASLTALLAAQNQRLDAQQQMAGTIKDESVSAAMAALQPILTLHTIRTRLDNGNAFQNELASLKDIGEAERAPLQTVAGGGSSLAQMAATVHEQQRQLAASSREAAAQTWWEKIKARLSGLITIRAAGDDQGDTAENAINQLASQIQSGDAAAALASIDQLPADTQALLGNIRDQLQKRQQAVQVLDSLSARLTGAAQ